MFRIWRRNGCICINIWNHVIIVHIFWFILQLNISNIHAQDIEGAGLPWVQFNSTDFRKVADLGVDLTIDMYTGISINDYSQIWIGMIKCPTDRKVTVTAEADNGLRLFIGDYLIESYENVKRFIRQPQRDFSRPNPLFIKESYYFYSTANGDKVYLA